MGCKSVVAAATILLSASLHGVDAATIVGGSSLLSNSNADLLASSIPGQQITFTNVFFYSPGDAPSAFHLATDDLSGLLVVAETSDGHLRGGYNPVNWSGRNGSVTGGLTSAFVFDFNSVSNEIYFPIGTTWGDHQPYSIYSLPEIWPAFGGGLDLTFGGDQSVFGPDHFKGYANPGCSYAGASFCGEKIQYFEDWSKMEIFQVSISGVPNPPHGQ